MATPTVQSLDRALDILEALGEWGEGRQVRDLCEELSLNKSTVSRMLNTLAQRGYVEKLKDGSYRLGVRIVELSSVHLNSLQLKTEALRFMEELKVKTGLIIHLGVLSDMEVVYLEKLSSYTNLRMYSQIGKRAYAHCTGLGKSMMAFMDHREVEKIIRTKGLPAITKYTITNADELYKKLDMIRENGYSIDEEENEENIRCVAAPIFDYTGNVIAAVSATGFKDVFTEDKINNVINEVMHCTESISRAMGYNKKRKSKEGQNG